MRETWQRRVARAEALSASPTASIELLTFYAALLRAQRDLFDRLSRRSDWRPTGSLDRDLLVFRTDLPTLFAAVVERAPDSLAIRARQLLDAGDNSFDESLCQFWRAPSDRDFFAKAIVQPYADWLAASGVAPMGRDGLPQAENRCPYCRGTPQLSLLRGGSDGALEGGGRALQCATCLTVWPFRRVVCAHCGEEDEHKLGYFQSIPDTAPFAHVRIEACDTCRHYLKGIDLTRLGTAVPLVDEVASAPLDAWATEHGYLKVELNLVGL